MAKLKPSLSPQSPTSTCAFESMNPCYELVKEGYAAVESGLLSSHLSESM